jgi:hypothetical protein
MLKVIYMVFAICPTTAQNINECEQRVDAAPHYATVAECKADSTRRAVELGTAKLEETGKVLRILYACVDAERKAEMFPEKS